jgi:hypothetical protein
MRRHPSFLARQLAAVPADDVAGLVHDFEMYSSTHTPA